MIFKSISEEVKTKEMCLTAVKLDGSVLKFVPEELKTVEMCLEAVKNGVWNLKYVPDRLEPSVVLPFIYSSSQAKSISSFQRQITADDRIIGDMAVANPRVGHNPFVGCKFEGNFKLQSFFYHIRVMNGVI